MKLKQFCNKFDVLYLRENNSWVGGVQHLTSSGALFLKVLGKNRVFECEERQREPGLDWLGGWEFLSKTNRSQIVGKGELAGWENCNWRVLSILDRCFL